MLRVPLGEMGAALEGAIPSPLASASREGVPNVTYLSIVQLVDDAHVALSFQFFNKTKRNVLNNPRAEVIVLDPVTNRQFRLSLEYERTETKGAVFSRMAVKLEAIATATGMGDVFELRGADVYRVVESEALPSNLPEAPEAPEAPEVARQTGDPAAHLAAFAERISRCLDLDSLLNEALAACTTLFGYHHAMILVPDESGESLYTIASRGYPETGIGSELRFGEGAIGVAALRRRPIRITNFGRDRRLSRAVRSEIARTEEPIVLGHEIPLPGLPDVQSQQAVPLLAAGRLLGVLCVESPESARFVAADELILTAAGHHLGAALALAEALALSDEGSLLSRGKASGPTDAASFASAESTLVRYYPSDDSVFIGGEYLIKGVAGRVLFKLLGEYTRTERTDFTNKEIRLDPTLGLPPIKDNLETRLLLLRRRLEERAGPIRLERSGRGQLRLHVAGPVRIEECAQLTGGQRGAP